MSEISERYGRLADAFASKIAGVPDDKWSSQSPCPDWKARDVVQHVLDTQGYFLKLVGDEMGELPPVDKDPVGAWKTALSKIKERLEDPDRAKQEFDGMMGRTTFEDSVNQFLCFDLVVHAWDLAKATGQEHTMEAEDIERTRQQAERMGDAMRGPGAFGPELPAAPDADAQRQLLAYLGRQA